jgi:hypothetical protein
MWSVRAPLHYIATDDFMAVRVPLCSAECSVAYRFGHASALAVFASTGLPNP